MGHTTRAKKLPGSLTWKLSLVLLAAALLPMLGTAYYTLQAGIDRVAGQEQQNLRLLASTTAERIDQFLGNVRKVVHILAADPEVAAFLDSEGAARKRYRATAEKSLATIARVVPMFESVYLMDRSGVFVATTNPKVQDKRYDFRPYFRHAIRGELYVSNLLFGSTSGRPGLYFSGPVQHEDGRILGVAVIKLRFDAITAILNRIGNERVATPMLVDSHGVVLNHPEPDLHHHSLAPLAPDVERRELKEKGLPVDRIEPLGLDTLWQAISAAPSGEARFQTPRGGPQVAGFAPLERLPWTLVMGKAEARFAAPLNELFHHALYGVSLVAVLVLLFSIGAGGALVRPITRLAGAANRVKRGAIQVEGGPFDPGQLALAPVTRRQDELGELARVFESMAGEVYRRQEELEELVDARTRELADKHAQLQAVHLRVAEELRVAKSLQQAILPTRFPADPRYDLFAVMTPAREMGGDFYDFFELTGNRIGVVVADVSGKGVPAAFFMAVARTEMHNAAQAAAGPGEALQAVNEVLCRENPLELFVTVLYGVFDPEGGHFTYACGGHNPPVRTDASGRSDLLPGTDGVALGVMEGLEYDEATVTLNPSEQVVLYTDGITEAFSAVGEAFGEARLLAACEEEGPHSARTTTERIVAAVDAFCTGV
ncbi:MAG TPA: SpoIIE family protein phosphatase, partial [Gammaproteobacteria bacterium]|nr:SpoIIE family protein phosphatase [Gammaproteobacteria bacterium]